MSPATLPADWQPTPGDIEYAKSKGFCEAQIADMAESFVTYFTSNAKGARTRHKNWSGGNGAFGNWVRSTSPWPAWRAEQYEPKKEWYERTADHMKDRLAYEGPHKLKPKLRRMPGPAKRYTQAEREAIITKLGADVRESRRPVSELKPRRVPMSDAVRKRFIEEGKPVPEKAEETADAQRRAGRMARMRAR